MENLVNGKLNGEGQVKITAKFDFYKLGIMLDELEMLGRSELFLNAGYIIDEPITPNNHV